MYKATLCKGFQLILNIFFFFFSDHPGTTPSPTHGRKCWDISTIYHVSEADNTIVEKNRMGENSAKYRQYITNLSTQGNKSSIFSINRL